MDLSENSIKMMVREQYGKVAQGGACCGDSCCSGGPLLVNIAEFGKKLDYSTEELALGAGDANMGLGCGNPLSISELQPGETVLDLGCGAGFDAFLAAKQVGDSGWVIGVDMTPEMIEKARANADKLGVRNVEFYQAEIERLPVPDHRVDVVISNCVINLCPSKTAVFKEIFRVLKPGGRIGISDVLRSGEMPEDLKNNPAAYTGCVSGAISPDEMKTILETAGFEKVSIIHKTQSNEIIKSWNIGKGTEKVVFSAYIKAFKIVT